MLSSDRRHVLRWLALGATAPLLGGCFRPLYGSSVTANVPGGGSVRDALKAIEVAEIKDRLGHYLRNDLVFELDGSGQPSPKRFWLSIAVKDSVEVVLVNSQTDRADAATLVVTADYQIAPIDQKDKPFSKGTITERVTYDRNPQRFAALRAARDAQIRAARVLAVQIRNRLATQFATGI
jgi:LPS-assembly lipoprotein